MPGFSSRRSCSSRNTGLPRYSSRSAFFSARGSVTSPSQAAQGHLAVDSVQGLLEVAQPGLARVAVGDGDEGAGVVAHAGFRQTRAIEVTGDRDSPGDGHSSPCQHNPRDG